MNLAGVFIGDDLGADFTARARIVSAVRDAARWGIYRTPSGGCPSIGMDIEGLFGPIVAQATYRQAVEAEVGVPITVFWLDAPRPDGQWGSAPFSVLEKLAHNQRLVRMVEDVVRRTPSDIGCLVCAESPGVIRKLKGLNVAEVSEALPAKERKVLLGDMSSGTIRKAIVSSGCWPEEADHGVMVVVTCGPGDTSGWRIPWRRLKEKGERAFVVDFRHRWDINNGRPGVLARNDEARERRYRELGFGQIAVSGVNELPFIGG